MQNGYGLWETVAAYSNYFFLLVIVEVYTWRCASLFHFHFDKVVNVSA